MSKQFRAYIVPSDIESILAELRDKCGLKIIEETAPTANPVEVASPLRRRSLWVKEKDFVSVRCYLVPNFGARVQMRFIASQGYWIVQANGVEGIEFSGCGFDGQVLLQGRFYFQKDTVMNDGISPKPAQFITWADKAFRIAKKQLRWSESLEAYVGTGADSFRKAGGRFATVIGPNGDPVYADTD